MQPFGLLSAGLRHATSLNISKNTVRESIESGLKVFSSYGRFSEPPIVINTKRD
jgi:hypothetical protein